MENRKVVFISLLVLFLTITLLQVNAVTYKVLYSNSSKIRIGGKPVAVGMVFDEKATVEWTSEEQAIKVLNMSTKRIRVIAAKALRKKGLASFADQVHKVNHLATREYAKEVIDVDTICYMLDTLRVFAGPHNGDDMIDEAIAYVNNDTIITQIPKSSDKKEFVLSRKIFGGKSPKVVYVDILETDEKMNWKYFVYRGLRIELLPLKVN